MKMESSTWKDLLMAVTTDSAIGATVTEESFTPRSMSAGSHTRPVKDKPISLYDIFLYYVHPVLIVFGFIGNSLSFIIMRKKTLSVSSTSFLLGCLAVADNLALIRATGIWIRNVIDFSYNDTPDIFCKARKIFNLFSVLFAAWMPVLVSLERFVVVYFPFKAKRLCSMRNAKIAVALLVSAFGLLVVVILLTYWKIGLGQCDSSGIEQYTREIGRYIYLSLYVYGPTISLFIINIAIVIKLRINDAIRGTMTNNAESSQSTIKATRMVLTVAFVYFALTLPYAVHAIINILSITNKIRVPWYIMEVVYPIAHMCNIINNAVNFIVYVVLSDKFRFELLGMWRAVSTWRKTALSTSSKNGTADTNTGSKDEGTNTTMK